MKSNIVQESKGNWHVQYELEDYELCLYCNCMLTNDNTCVLEITSNEYEDTKPFCKPCTAILLRDMNIKIAQGNGIAVCFSCGIPKYSCKCNSKKIDYNIRKKLK